LKKKITVVLLISILISLILPSSMARADFLNGAPALIPLRRDTVVATRLDSSTRVNDQNHNFHTFEVDGQNFIRVRDLAYMLSDTPMRFSVAWNSENRTVELRSNSPYVAVGHELTKVDPGGKTGTTAGSLIFIDERLRNFNTLNIGGETYFRLRDLASAFDFSINWNAQNQSIIISNGAEQVAYSISASQGQNARRRILHTSNPVIALTFDDGPGNATNAILDVLAQHNVHATFFVLGNRVYGNSDTMVRMANRGHEIGNHSWSHPRLPRLSEARIRDEIINTNNVITNVTGVTPVLFRAPYGLSGNRVENIVGSLGLPLINWSLDPRDWQSRNANTIYRDVMRDVRDRDILLFHDIHDATGQAMIRLVPSLLNQGFQFVTVSELMCFSGITLQPGTIYTSGR